MREAAPVHLNICIKAGGRRALRLLANGLSACGPLKMNDAHERLRETSNRFLRAGTSIQQRTG